MRSAARVQLGTPTGHLQSWSGMASFIRRFFGKDARKVRAMKKELRSLKMHSRRHVPDGEQPDRIPDAFLADPSPGHNLGD